MKNTTVQITYPTEKLEAIKQYIGRKEIDMAVELQEALSRLYEKHVPRDVREFLEAREAAQPDKPPRPRRPARPPAPETPTPPAHDPAAATGAAPAAFSPSGRQELRE